MFLLSMRSPRNVPLASVMLITMAAFGCADELRTKVESLRPGMNLAEVERIAGPSREVTSQQIAKAFPNFVETKGEDVTYRVWAETSADVRTTHFAIFKGGTLVDVKRGEQGGTTAPGGPLTL